ncbi:endosomal peripheral membrane protein [Cordyceps fumosorosea ARSEF 2679]|uniref:Endosomal peripheral membrane protein n=1 Tax=Cordyceps fumosorosea (strain ARSEF 2679) TaxID=1081104 RepID=A0A167XC51_CORFA|nr:endosomal peripheral membrane protein [Cordyceps fumosorosea ARSEF 2679]OAA64787.1 endosomal peripheral membrane protein [Cordyceps fumosorosea ARSEF 2679]
MANFSNEVRSVETAASRLFESTIDFPDEQFAQVIQAICGLLTVQNSSESPSVQPQAKVPLKPGQGHHRRVLSFSNQTVTDTNQELLFALAKLGEIASINSERLLTSDPDKSGWDLLVAQLGATLDSTTMSTPVRIRAAEVLARFMLESGSIAAGLSEDLRGSIQLRLLEGLRDSLTALRGKKREDSVAGNATDLEIHRVILEGLRQILENYGESLVEGWDVAFDIIGSVFVTTDTIPEDKRDSSKAVGTRSSKLVRSAFGSLQLICSDFLASLPNGCFLILVDALYNFSSQDDDLNIALTTVTFFWMLSDFLSGRSKSLEITEELMKGVGSTSLVNLAENSEDKNSSAALWLLLLQRLTARHGLCVPNLSCLDFCHHFRRN